MNKFMLSLIALCAFAHTAHANDFDGYQEEESAYSQEAEMSQDEAAMMSDDVAAYGRGGGRGDGRGPGRGGPGWGRPGHGPGRPGPGYPPGHGGPRPGPRPPGHGGPGHGGPGYPHPGPGYPPPHQPSVEYVTCESYGSRYNTCYVNPYGIRRVYLARQLSNTRCDANRTFGLSGNYIWVDRGCRGVFAVERY